MQYAATIVARGALLNGKAPKIIQAGLDRVMVEAIQFLIREVKERTPQGVYGAQGGLLGSIQGEVLGKGTPLIKGIVFSSQKYAEVVEKGRRPGKGMPPPGVLLRWIEVKLGVDERTAKSLEFVIRRKIGQKGFEGAHMFERALDENFSSIQKIFRKEGFSIVRRLASE